MICRQKSQTGITRPSPGGYSSLPSCLYLASAVAGQGRLASRFAFGPEPDRVVRRHACVIRKHCCYSELDRDPLEYPNSLNTRSQEEVRLG